MCRAAGDRIKEEICLFLFSFFKEKSTAKAKRQSVDLDLNQLGLRKHKKKRD